MVDLANTGKEPGSRGGESICPTASPHLRRRKIVVGYTLLQHPPANTILGEREPDQVPQLTSRTPPGQTTPPGTRGSLWRLPVLHKPELLQLQDESRSPFSGGCTEHRSDHLPLFSWIYGTPRMHRETK